MDKLLVIQTWGFGRYFPKNEQVCHFKETNTQYLLSVTQFELSSEN